MPSLSGRTNNKNIPKFPNDIGTAGQCVKLKTDVKDGFEYVGVADFTLPISSNTTLGGVKIDGNNLSIDGNGVLSATNTEYTAGTNISITDEVISATTSIPIASNNALGGVKIDGNNLYIDGNGVLSATAASGITNLDNYSQDNAILINSEDNDVQLKTNSTTRLSIENGGNVGIGVTSPSEKLDVDGNITCSNRLLTASGDNTHYLIPNPKGTSADASNFRIIHLGLMGANQNQGQIRLGRQHADDRFHSIHVDSDNLGVNNYMAFAIHRGSPGSTGQVNVMALRGDGTVGIGIETASEKLEVDGNIKCTDLKFQYGGSEAILTNIVGTIPLIGYTSNGTNYAAALTGNRMFVNVPDTAIMVATTNALGGIKLGYTATGTTHAVQLNASNLAYVDVPAVTASSTDSGGIKLGNTATGTTHAAQLNASNLAYVDVPAVTAPNTDLGGINLGYTATGTTHAAQLNAPNLAYVDVPAVAASSTDSGGIKLRYTATGTTHAAQLNASNLAYVDVSAVTASSTDLGGIKLGYTATGTTHAVQLNASNLAYVDVPAVAASSTDLGGIKLGYTATGTTHAAQLNAPNLAYVDVPAVAASSTDLGGIKLGYTATGTTHAVQLIGSSQAYVDVPAVAAPSTDLGGIKVGFTSSGSYYAVELDSSNKALVDVPDTAVTVATTTALGGIKLGYTATGTTHAAQLNASNLAYVDAPIPMATDDTLGGVIIDGGNLNINASTGKLPATIVKKQSLLHVDTFSLQQTTNLRTSADTKISWKPPITFGTSGLFHDEDNAIPNGALFMCNDSAGGVYTINVQIAITAGTAGRSFHVLELRTFTGGSNRHTEGTPSRTYFIGSGYARVLSGTNKCFYGGSIQITTEENDQFQVVSTRKYVSGTTGIELNGGVDATRLIIDRLIID